MTGSRLQALRSYKAAATLGNLTLAHNTQLAQRVDRCQASVTHRQVGQEILQNALDLLADGAHLSRFISVGTIRLAHVPQDLSCSQ